MRIFLSFILLYCMEFNYAQIPFNKVTDFNGTFAQFHGEDISAIDSMIVVGGECMIDDEDGSHSHFCVSLYNQNGEPLRYGIWENNVESVQNALRFPNEVIEFNDTLYYAVASLGVPIQCLVKSGKAVDNVLTHTCYHDSLNSELLIVYSLVHYPEGFATVALQNEDSKREGMLAKINLREKGKYEIVNFSQLNGWHYWPMKLLNWRNNELLMMGHWGIPGENNSPIYQDYGFFIYTLDEEFNIVKKTYPYGNLTGIFSDMTGIVDSDSCLVMTALGIDRELNDQTGNRSYMPSILKFDKDLNPVWRTEFGKKNFNAFPESHFDIVESHNQDGYIVAGGDLELGRAVIGKVSAGGDSLWHKVVHSLYEPGALYRLADLAKTPDGNYIASGTRFRQTQDDSISSFIQLWMIKFDENGDVVDNIISSNEDEPIRNEQVKIYPNPSSGIFYIDASYINQMEFNLYDLLGNKLKSEQVLPSNKILMLDLTNFPSGRYLLEAVSVDKKERNVNWLNVMR